MVMKRLSRLLLAGFASLALMVLPVSATFADSGSTLSQDDLKNISNNCLSIKNTMNQLHTSDALLRVNRGQLYELMLSKLMNPFDTRLKLNGIDNKTLVTAATTYSNTLTTFRSDYQNYDEQMTAALTIDCTKQPAKFYDSVASVRTKRLQVHDDVVALNAEIDSYSALVDQFSLNFQSGASTK